MKSYDKVPMEKVIEIKIEKIKYYLMHHLNKEMLLEGPISVCQHYLLDEFTFQIKGFIFGENQEPIIIQYPRTWWQHIKERFFPKFMLKKWPVWYTKTEIDRKLVYPDIKVSLPHEKHHIIYQRHESLYKGQK